MSGSTIRYTVDGPDPPVTDPVATVSIAVTQNRTIRAKAWKAGFTPSAVQTFSYVLKPLSPSITSTPGAAPGHCTITLASQAGLSGVDLRYTLDGGEPGAPGVTSTLYAGPFDSGGERHRHREGVPSGLDPERPHGPHLGVHVDDIAPTITARVRPGVNAHGWTLGPATVTFICHDSDGPYLNSPISLASCSPAKFVAEETDSDPFTGTAVDLAGNSAM